MRSVERALLPLLAVTALVGAIALLPPATADARPRISGFSVKDEGSRIHLRVKLLRLHR